MSPNEPEKREDREEDALRAKMRDLREGDHRSAPPFDPMWRAAGERAKTRGKAAPRWLAPSAGIASLAAAAAVALFSVRSADRAAPSSAAAPVAASAAPASSPVSVSTPAVTAGARSPFASRPELALDFLLTAPSATDVAALTSFDSDPLSRRAGGL